MGTPKSCERGRNFASDSRDFSSDSCDSSSDENRRDEAKDLGTPNSTTFKFREAAVDFGDPSHSSSCQEAACTTRSRTLISRYPPPRWSHDRIRDQAKSHRRCPANPPMDLKRRWPMDLDVLCPLEWVAGVSPTHGLPEAIIVVGDVDKAAV